MDKAIETLLPLYLSKEQEHKNARDAVRAYFKAEKIRPDPFSEEIGPSFKPVTVAKDELGRHFNFLDLKFV